MVIIGKQEKKDRQAGRVGVFFSFLSLSKKKRNQSSSSLLSIVFDLFSVKRERY